MELAALVIFGEEDGGCVVNVGCAGWWIVNDVVMGFCF